MTAIVAVAVAPPAVFHFADVPLTPWWVVGTVVLVQLVAVTPIVIYHRAQARS